MSSNNSDIKQDTWLPVFTGYYHSIFDASEDFNNYEAELTEQEYQEYYEELHKAGVTFEYFYSNLWNYCDFSKCFNEASESIAYALIDSEHLGIIKGVEYQKTVSPKYYNFSTDSIDCAITYDQPKLLEYLNNNLEALKDYIERRYTSCDGFNSHYPNELNYWLDTENWGQHEVGALLNFLLHNEDSEAELTLYYNSNLSEVFSNNVEIDFKGMIQDFNEDKKTA